MSSRIPTFDVIQGDARRIPRPDGSVHMCACSPPYWSLRDYGIEPSVWGGDEACAHEWGDVERAAKANSVPGPNGCVKNEGFHDSKAGLKAAGQFCQKCSAWRGCLGLEPTPELFVEHIVIVFREIRRVLRKDGTAWLNLGDSYAGAGQSGGNAAVAGTMSFRGKTNARAFTPVGLKPKDLCFIPHRVAMALQADGWYVRDTIIWHKPNPMPSSVTDRTTTAHEYVFLLTKSARYFYDADAIREPVTSTGGASIGKQNHDATGTGQQSRKFASPEERNNPLGRNKRSVWTIPTQSCPEAHFATYPTRLVEPMVKAGTSEKGCCPACGAPWRRVVERVRDFASGSGRSGNMPVGKNGANMQGGGETLDIRRGPIVSSVTVAWLSTCKCNAKESYCTACCTVIESWHGTNNTSTTQDMHRMRKHVRSASDNEHVLQPGLLSEIPTSVAGFEVHSVPGDVSAGISAPEMLLKAVCPTMVSGQPTIDKGLVENEQGIHPRASAAASPREQNGLCAEAPIGHGEEARPVSAQVGGCPPSQREQDGQQTAESGSHDQTKARQDASTDVHGDLPTLPTHVCGSRTCPHCGSCKVVIRDAVKPCTVLDPFSGAGTTGIVCDRLGRSYVGIEPKAEYIEITHRRLANDRERRALRKVKRQRPVVEAREDEPLLFAAGGHA